MNINTLKTRVDNQDKKGSQYFIVENLCERAVISNLIIKIFNAGTQARTHEPIFVNNDE